MASVGLFFVLRIHPINKDIFLVFSEMLLKKLY